MTRRNKWDELLTALFMVLAVAAVVSFFAARNQPYYLIFGGIAVLLRIVQYVMRMFL
jgi:membrane protein YdbS with pleckstrin-like domain